MIYSPELADRLKKARFAKKSPQIIRSPTEPWEYLGAKSRTDAQRYGLIYFMYSLLSIMKQIGASSNSEIWTSLVEVRKLLKFIKESIEQIAIEGLAIDMADLTLPLMGCMQKLPQEKPTMANNPAQQLSPQAPVMRTGTNRDGKRNQTQSKELMKPPPASLMLPGGMQEDFVDYLQKGNETEDINFGLELSPSITIQLDDPNSKKFGRIEVRLKHFVDRLVSLLRHYLIIHRLSFEELVQVLALKPNSGYYGYFKKVLSIDEKEFILDTCMVFLRGRQQLVSNPVDLVVQSVNVSLAEFLRDLTNLEAELLTLELPDKFGSKIKQPLTLKRANQSKQVTDEDFANPDDSEAISDQHLKFLKLYACELLNRPAQLEEMNGWVTRIKQMMLMMESEDDLVTFLKTLQVTFIRSGHLTLLLRTFKAWLTKEAQNAEDEGSEENSQFKWLQNLLVKSELDTLCLSVFQPNNSESDVVMAAEILIKLLELGNHGTQVSILTTLQENFFTKEFFSFIEAKLLSYLETLKEEIKKTAEMSARQTSTNRTTDNFEEFSKTDVINTMLKMLKLLCDNCYLECQDFLRVQVSDMLKDNPFTVDVVTSVVGVLVAVVRECPAASNLLIGQLIKTLLNTLNEFVIGPCTGNQRILIENKKLMQVINAILETDIQFDDPQPSEVDVLQAQIMSECAIVSIFLTHSS